MAGYKNKIEIDYEGLPKWAIKDIQDLFDQDSLDNRNDYSEWQGNVVTSLNSIAKEQRPLFLKKGIEFAQKAYSYHLENDCGDKSECRHNECWERQIVLTQNMLDKLLPSEQITNTTSNIKFAGSKIDLIRVLNALYELKKIEGLNNSQVPPKKDFMIAAGQFFNINLSDYDTSLSQAIKEGNEDANLKIFEDMKQAFYKIWLEKTLNK